MRQLPHTLRALAALLWLAYLVAGTQVLPAGLAVLAEFDEEHQLIVAHTAVGYELVLTHGDEAPTPAPYQHRHELGRWLATLSALNGHGDHSCRLAILEAATGSDREDKLGESKALQTVFVALQPLPWAVCPEKRCELERSGAHGAERPRAPLQGWRWDSVQLQV